MFNSGFSFFEPPDNAALQQAIAAYQARASSQPASAFAGLLDAPQRVTQQSQQQGETAAPAAVAPPKTISQMVGGGESAYWQDMANPAYSQWEKNQPGYFDPYAGIATQQQYGSPGEFQNINQATTADNYAALLDQEKLKALGAPPSFVSVNTGGGGDSAQMSNQINPAFTEWAKANRMSLSGDWGANSNNSALTDSSGKQVATGSLAGDDTFWKAALAATAFTGASVYGAGAGAGASSGGSPLGIQGATYATPGAESGFSLANAGANSGGFASSIGANEGAAQLAASVANFAPISQAQIAAMLPEFSVAAGGAAAGGAIGSSIGANEGATQLAASVANMAPPTQAEIMALMPDAGLLGSGAGSAASVFNAAKDSQAASAAAGYNPATMATGVPSTVDLGSLGGTMGTAGGLQGAFDAAKQVGGDMLGSAGSAAGSAAAWMAQNPGLAKLLTAGAGGLLGGLGGQQGNAGASAPVYGAPKSWTGASSVDTSLLAPAQRQQPQGLLNVLGQPNSGAWRFAKRG
jgi:hypothetical protein